MAEDALRIAMLSIHSSPISELGTNDAGGMSVCVRELAREFGARGHKVDIYTRLADLRDNPTVDLYKNVRLIHLSAGAEGPLKKSAIYPCLDDFFAALDAYKKQENRHYDLIHSHYWLSGQVGCQAQNRWRVPQVVMFHTLGRVKNIISGTQRESDFRITTEAHVAKNCHRILAFTEKERGYLTRYYGTSPEKIGIVPGGVNLNIFRPLDKFTARQQLGYDPDALIMLYVGRFAPGKGLRRLLKTHACMSNNPRRRLVLVGGNGYDSTESRHLQELSRSQGIHDSVIFAGRIEQKYLAAYYSAADLLLLPSHYESFGLVALESLACGTPVVATQVGALRDIILEGKTGHLVTDDSPVNLARGIESFLSASNPLTPQAIRDSVLGFSWQNIATKIIDEYLSVLMPRCRKTG